MRSLLIRLLAVTVSVSVLSVVATAYLAVRATTRAIAQEQGQARTEDAEIYDALAGYAATHPDWNDAGPLVRELAERTGHRIAVTDRDRVPLAESAAGLLPERASATVDPLTLDGNLARELPEDRIDPRAIGPFRITDVEHTRLTSLARTVVECLAEPYPQDAVAVPMPAVAEEPRQVQGPIEARIVDGPTGRPVVEIVRGDLGADTMCRTYRADLAAPVASETAALSTLGDLTNACLDRQGLPHVRLAPDRTWQPRENDAATGICLAGARREQLAAHVAPAVLLFVTTPGDPAPGRVGLDLSPANRARIIGVTALVLLVTIGVTVLAGLRLVRPLHALTAAAGRMRDGDAGTRVRVRGRDEIARLGAAFNAMSEQRQRVEELRKAMVGDIAHEMRTPVTNIRGWLEAVEDGVVPLDAELVTSLLEEAVLLQHVIADLQDLSAADAGELRLHPRPVDAAELLRGVADAFGAAAERAGVTLSVHAEPITVSADPIRLRQAVGNLVSNAIRHTPSGGTVTVTARTDVTELAVDVADTGPGIAAEQRDLVFERFWRADGSRSRQTGGSGLGLSIVRKLAEAHGGSVSVDSPPGSGATFTLRIPLR
ncbi:sensor histidine kinase [Catenuloplanes japonicus]|uniref:sensor histidine kinase n=1 Tax=Catenuloplanes japonicus TaxID=33876 RepID=UPI0005248D8B|nr:HAMP domain-containing sensor histidine kinase [Catenuloplanes japonicus]